MAIGKNENLLLQVQASFFLFVIAASHTGGEVLVYTLPPMGETGEAILHKQLSLGESKKCRGILPFRIFFFEEGEGTNASSDVTSNVVCVTLRPIPHRPQDSVFVGPVQGW